MLNFEGPKPGLLFGSFLYRSDLYNEDDLKGTWENLYGESFILRPKLNPLLSYYAKEMKEADHLKRFFIATSKTYPRESLLSSKIQALDWEKKWSESSERRVNVDTGFLSLENFLLATTKNYSHRIYIGQNLFADLTYHFHEGGFQALPWTYPDYQDDEKLEFLTWLRSYLLTSLPTV